MTKKEAFNISLTKWPGLIVIGKSIAPLQAQEVLIRTNSYFSTNDSDFLYQILELYYGRKGKKSFSAFSFFENKDGKTDWEEYRQIEQETQQKYGVLDLNYLDNSRVVSCWIGGPKGWCNWDGTIYSTSYNIGKWPSVEEVYDDWVLIAKTFPFLELTSYLLSGESGEVGSVPVIEFKVKDGRVKILKPKTIQVEQEEIDFTFYRKGGERGCTLQQFAKALEYTQSQVALEKK